MSLSSGFFDAVQVGDSYDRVYSASDFAHYFSLLVGNGVFPSPETGLNVLATKPASMTVTIGDGSGWINGYFVTVKGGFSVVLDAASGTMNRIDSIIAQWNNTDRKINIIKKKGTPSASPTPVTLQRDAEIWEIELAQITVEVGVSSISQTKIKDMRADENRCGIVTALLKSINPSTFLKQSEAEFDAWFQTVMNKISDEDVAGSLLAMITNVDNREQSHYNELSSKIQSLSSIDLIDTLRTGDIIPSARKLDGVKNMLSCDGRRLSVTTYNQLFELLGYAYGGTLPTRTGSYTGIKAGIGADQNTGAYLYFHPTRDMVFYDAYSSSGDIFLINGQPGSNPIMNRLSSSWRPQRIGSTQSDSIYNGLTLDCDYNLGNLVEVNFGLLMVKRSGSSNYLYSQLFIDTRSTQIDYVSGSSSGYVVRQLKQATALVIKHEGNTISWCRIYTSHDTYDVVNLGGVYTEEKYVYVDKTFHSVQSPTNSNIYYVQIGYSLYTYNVATKTLKKVVNGGVSQVYKTKNGVYICDENGEYAYKVDENSLSATKRVNGVGPKYSDKIAYFKDSYGMVFRSGTHQVGSSTVESIEVYTMHDDGYLSKNSVSYLKNLSRNVIWSLMSMNNKIGILTFTRSSSYDYGTCSVDIYSIGDQNFFKLPTIQIPESEKIHYIKSKEE